MHVCIAMKQNRYSKEVSELNDKLSVEIKDLEKDADLALQYGVTLTPSFVMLNHEGHYTGVMFNGIPAGHEINSFYQVS